MNHDHGFGLTLIGERINPGFRSSRALFEQSDLEGIQALARKQAQAGADCLNVNIGTRALDDPAFMAEAVRAIQDAVDIPLSFDFQTMSVQQLCLSTYDAAKAGGRKPIVNSITEHRWDLVELRRDFDFRVVCMASERVDDGVGRPNKTTQDIYVTARRSALRLMKDWGFAADDILIDLSVSAMIADTEGLGRATLDAIELIGADPELKGIHMMGGLSNIGQQLPARAADGSDLKHKLECAFLTLAVPRGFDTVLGTPWRGYAPLPEDDYVLGLYRQFLDCKGTQALRAVRRLYKAT